MRFRVPCLHSHLHTELCCWGRYRYTQLSSVSLSCILMYDIVQPYVYSGVERFTIVTAQLLITRIITEPCGMAAHSTWKSCI